MKVTLYGNKKNTGGCNKVSFRSRRLETSNTSTSVRSCFQGSWLVAQHRPPPAYTQPCLFKSPHQNTHMQVVKADSDLLHDCSKHIFSLAACMQLMTVMVVLKLLNSWYSKKPKPELMNLHRCAIAARVFCQFFSKIQPVTFDMFGNFGLSTGIQSNALGLSAVFGCKAWVYGRVREYQRVQTRSQGKLRRAVAPDADLVWQKCGLVLDNLNIIVNILWLYNWCHLCVWLPWLQALFWWQWG